MKNNNLKAPTFEEAKYITGLSGVEDYLANKDVDEYLKHKDEINSHYSYALKEGFAHNEDATWEERLDYWRRSI